MKIRKLTYGLGAAAAATVVALTAPLASAAPHYLGVAGKQLYLSPGCYNLSDLTNSQEPLIQVSNQLGYPVYIHPGSDCKMPPSKLFSGDDLQTGPTDISIYIPPAG